MTHHRDLATKICVVCRREFAWRKKWEQVWAEVKFCSERCRRAKVSSSGSPMPSSTDVNVDS
jgi:hypothetical protein